MAGGLKTPLVLNLHFSMAFEARCMIPYSAFSSFSPLLLIRLPALPKMFNADPSMIDNHRPPPPPTVIYTQRENFRNVHKHPAVCILRPHPQAVKVAVIRMQTSRLCKPNSSCFPETHTPSTTLPRILVPHFQSAHHSRTHLQQDTGPLSPRS